jgi:ferritin
MMDDNLAVELQETYGAELNDMLDYLDMVRETGVTNMFGAAPYLAEQYDLENDEARKVLQHWMRTFSERQAAQR